ncbi:hypothetical protein JW948_08185 [bacterium]|nr:hypothetical protein [bacterium]
MKRSAMVLVLVLSVGLGNLAGQDVKSKIEARLEDFSGQARQNLQNYMQPFVDAFGANLNSGLYHTAKIPKRGFHIYVGIESILALISDDQRTYTALFEDPAGSMAPFQETGAPTVFGKKDGKQVTVFGNTWTLPGGTDLRALPLIAPRITIGSVMGTELMIRWVEATPDKDLGLLKLTGFGLRHSITQYFPLAPIDFCFGFFIQDMEVGRIFKSSITLVQDRIFMI